MRINAIGQIIKIRGTYGYSTFSGGLTNSQAQKSIKEVSHFEST